MADDAIDTQAAPPVDTVGDAGADQATDKGADQATDQVDTQSTQPQSPTPDEIIRQAEERAFQRTASWLGRRDKDLIDNIGNLIEQRLKTAVPAPQTTEKTDINSLLENPDAWAESKLRTVVPQIFDQELQRRTKAEQQYTTELIKNAGSIMDSDPLFNDKEFGKQVIEEVQKGFGSLDKRLPPDVNAQLVINNAITSVYRKQALTKKNALAGNQPGKTVGTITPPATQKTTVKAPKLSDTAQSLAKRWGYSNEDLAKLFPDG
jgi:hypothetical protein